MPLLPIKGAWELTHVPQIRREELVVALPPVKEGHRSSSHVPPNKKGGAYCCPSLQSPPPIKGT